MLLIKKKYITLFLLALLVFADSSHSQTPSSSLIFEERVYNFGTIEEAKGKVYHTFSFRNNGKTPVTINDVNTGCGCISESVTKGAIKPGEKGTLKIVFDPSYKSGFFSKEIVVLSNNGAEYNRIWVEGIIKPAEHPIEDDYPYNFGRGLFLRLEVVAFGYLKPGETKQMALHCANTTDKEVVLDFKTDDNTKGLKLPASLKVAPRGKGVVYFSYTMPFFRNKDVMVNVYPYLDDKKLSKPIVLKILDGYNIPRYSK